MKVNDDGLSARRRPAELMHQSISVAPGQLNQFTYYFHPHLLCRNVVFGPKLLQPLTGMRQGRFAELRYQRLGDKARVTFRHVLTADADTTHSLRCSKLSLNIHFQ